MTEYGEYSVTKSYDALQGRQERMKKVSLVWNSVMMPRHRFIVWLVYQERLLTKARFQKLNMLHGDNKCNICAGNKVETQMYLFVECAWTKAVQQALYSWSGIAF